MLLAHVVLSAAVSINAPPRSDVVRPCADVSALCRISPFFCPGAYPAGLEPCWPEASRQTHELPAGRPLGTTRTLRAAPSEPAATPDRSGSRSATRPAKTTQQQER